MLANAPLKFFYCKSQLDNPSRPPPHFWAHYLWSSHSPPTFNSHLFRAPVYISCTLFSCRGRDNQDGRVREREAEYVISFPHGTCRGRRFARRNMCIYCSVMYVSFSHSSRKIHTNLSIILAELTDCCSQFTRLCLNVRHDLSATLNRSRSWWIANATGDSRYSKFIW